MIKKNFLFSLIILASCTATKKQDDTPPQLSVSPKTFPVDTANGYKKNVITGETINPMVNRFGDTVKTGIVIPVKGKWIDPATVALPVTIPAGKPREIPAWPEAQLINAYKIIPATLNEPYPLASEHDTTHYVLNKIGQKVMTGVPVPARWKTVKAMQPPLVPALGLRMKDNAVTDLQYMDIEQGLISSAVNSLLEDSRGNIWIGTAEGISVYDGKNFRHYTVQEGLSGNAVSALLEDRKGNIWIGTTGGGLSVYDGKYFRHYSEQEGIANPDIETILEDRKGNIWFATNKGVSRYDGKNFIHYAGKEGITGDYVGDLMEDNKGNIWMAIRGGGACMYDGKNIRLLWFDEEDDNYRNIINNLLEDHQGNIWLGTFGGLSIYDGKNFRHYTKGQEELFNDFPTDIIEDSRGHVWVGNSSSGISVYHENSVKYLTEKEGLCSNSISSMMEDSRGNIWIGTSGGLSVYRGKGFGCDARQDELIREGVADLLLDSQGNIWIGTYGNGAFKYNGNAYTQFTKREGLINSSISCLLEDRKGNIWLGCNYGLNKYDGSKFVHYTGDEGLTDKFIQVLLEDRKGNIWIGTGEGLNLYNGNNFVHFTEQEGLTNADVYCLLEDHQGNIWIGTSYGGVTMYDGRSFRHFTEREGLSNSKIMALLEDKQHNIWIGTKGGGVTMYDGKSFMHFTEREGLSSNYIRSLFQDSIGHVWVATGNGLNVISPVKTTGHKTPAAYTITVINRQDGIKGIAFLKSVLLDHKNRAWWGTGSGLQMLDLHKFKISQAVPQPRLKQLDINEQVINYAGLADSVKQGMVFDGVAPFENYPLDPSLPYYLNHLTFRFSAIDWAAPHKIIYQYRLQGLDAKWSEITSENIADYRNIPYGTYTFEVRAAGESQQWSPSFKYSFSIRPPWWHTTWFRIICGILVVIVFYSIYRWRTTSLRKQKLFLEKTVEERTMEIVQQKEIIEEKHKEITDSINYAERIQHSFMATKELLDENLEDYFVFFRPKEVVSGDFYWANKLNDGRFAFACADSTGHGVPGAIMSILNISALEKSVETASLPSAILNQTRKIIIDRLKKDGSAEGGKDGMDVSLIVLNRERDKMYYAAANNPVWILRNGKIIELEPDKMPVGKHDKDGQPFSAHEIAMEKGDLIYCFTDGFADQFGGPKGKKYKYASLKTLLIAMAHFPMLQQKEKLALELEQWKGDLEQVDDVLIVGIRI